MVIYWGNKPIYLTDQTDQELLLLQHQPTVMWVEENSTHAINALMHEIKRKEVSAGVMFSPDFAELKKKFFAHFKQITAAGGLVENQEGKFLFIFRRGTWDLPKGKLEKGETIEACAMREIEEETGIGKLEMVKKLGASYHLYDEAGKHILKESVWYHFKTHTEGKLAPQTEEDITEARWVTYQEMLEMRRQSYATIRDILTDFIS